MIANLLLVELLKDYDCKPIVKLTLAAVNGIGDIAGLTETDKPVDVEDYVANASLYQEYGG